MTINAAIAFFRSIETSEGHMSQDIIVKGKPTTAEKEVPRYLYEFVKSYVYRLYLGELQDDDAQVVGAAAVTDMFTRRPQLITVTDELDGRFLRVADAMLISTMRFKGEEYHVTIFLEVSHGDTTQHIVYVLGLRGGSTDATRLLEYLLSQAMKHSPYRNRTLIAKSEERDGIGLDELSIEEDRFEEIFLPDAVQRHVLLFVHALKEFERVHRPLRYLLSGNPGTGKTKVIRAVANACKGYATFIFANGSERRVDDLLDIAAMFSPVVLCIDDIDMLTGSRQEGLYTRQLATFLQRLDGFSRKDFFLLATTNDKALVDVAASRPGRFDQVIDVSSIDPAHYLSLVRSKTGNVVVVSLFGESVLESMRRKRVTGAFIANLVKHLELTASFEPEVLNQEFVLEAIEESHRGFYKPLPEESRGVGFRAA